MTQTLKSKTKWGYRSILENGSYDYTGLTIGETRKDKNENEWQELSFELFDGIPNYKIASPQTDLKPGDYPVNGKAIVKNDRLADLIEG